MTLAVILVLGVGLNGSAQDWPQWRGPLGQGITTAKNLPPAAGSNSLKELWKTPIPGEGCSSPIICAGRVYLTTAYEGSQRHRWDQPTFWAAIILAGAVTVLSLTQVWRILRLRSASFWGFVLGAWTVAIVALMTVVLAKPQWFWQFSDPWIGSHAVAAAELPWVETFSLRPVIVLLCGSLLLIFTALAFSPAPFSSWISLLTIFVTLAGGALLGLIAWQSTWFFQASQPWLAWLVTGGVGLFALAGSIGWLFEFEFQEKKSKWAAACIFFVSLSPCLLVLTTAGWLFANAPCDEFGVSLSLQNRIIYLVPGLMLLTIYTFAALKARRAGEGAKGKLKCSDGFLVPILLFLFSPLLALVVFIRANYLHPQTGVVRAVVCLDANNGEVLWTTPVFIAPPEKRHSLNSLATPTPACDGERVYAYFGSALAALDIDGRLVWLKRDADFADFIRYGAGSSVVLADDKIIIYRDSEFMGHGHHLDDNFKDQPNRRPSALTAYDKASGAEAWSISPPFSHDSYMTPLVWTRDGQREVIIATWKMLAGFAVNDGALRWTHPYPMQQIVPSPAVNGDCLIVTGGNILPGPIMAVRAPTPTTSAKTIWSNSKTGSNIVSPVCWNGLLFSVSPIGSLTCREAVSGQIQWTERLNGRCLASLVVGDGKVYALDQEGTLHVFAADTTGSVLATYFMRETSSATPALAPSMLFVRTSGHLYCIGSGE